MQNQIELNKLASKKNSDIKSILDLLQDLIVFQDKIEQTYELQENPQRKSQIKNYYNMVDQMYQELLDLAKFSVASVRKSSTDCFLTQKDAICTDNNLICNV